MTSKRAKDPFERDWRRNPEAREDHEREVAALKAAESYVQKEPETTRTQELEAVANGVIWLDNNIHQYGTDAWRGFFKAVLRDARRAMAMPGSYLDDKPEEGGA